MHNECFVLRKPKRVDERTSTCDGTCDGNGWFGSDVRGDEACARDVEDGRNRRMQRDGGDGICGSRASTHGATSCGIGVFGSLPIADGACVHGDVRGGNGVKQWIYHRDDDGICGSRASTHGATSCGIGASGSLPIADGGCVHDDVRGGNDAIV